ncbi:MAG: LysR family transcriptional regulator [Kineosporiaceae bacterium]
MRIEQLEYLRAVTRLGSLRRAADELHLSQPALSETIRNLERELGVALLERHRSGATISDDGRELLPHISEVLDAVDKLRRAADASHRGARSLRLGTAHAATVPLLVHALRAFGEEHPETTVEVISAQQRQIHQGLRDGSLDLGLVNYLATDDPPTDLESVVVRRGRAVACLHPASPLCALPVIGPLDLLTEPLVVMRQGYLMHRYVHRFVGDVAPGGLPVAAVADGAEMGKLMVAEGLGATLLPDFSVIDDPLHREGLIVARPLAPRGGQVLMVLQRTRSAAVSRAVLALAEHVVEESTRTPANAAAAAGDAVAQ